MAPSSEAPSNLTQLLEGIGLGTLEAEIYAHLLQSPPGTGYKIAKSLGRSFTTTYRALESLKAEGAVLSEDGEGGLFRAVPAAEFLEQLDARFRRQRSRVLSAVESLPSGRGDDRIYRLGTVAQVYERYRQMLQDCEGSALSELSPEPCDRLREDLAVAGTRGLRIAVRTYAGEELQGVRTVHSPLGEQTLEAVGSQWLTLFVDGQQFLLALITHGGTEVLEAVWSESLFLARMFHSYVNSDLLHYSFMPLLDTANSMDELRGDYQSLLQEFPPGGDLGFRELCGGSPPPDEPDPPDPTGA